MADVQANIVLTTTGGDQAASEVMKATTAINSMTSASSGMEATFQHRFQHIGLMLFAGDALRASGLGREARLVITSLNAALVAGEEVAGLSAGGMMLVVTALVALAGIAVKVIQHHKDMTDALMKLQESQEKSVEATDSEISVLEKYKDALGSLPPQLQKLLDSEEQLRQQEIKNKEVTNQELISAINLRIEKQKELLANLQDMIAAEEKVVGGGQLPKYLTTTGISADTAREGIARLKTEWEAANTALLKDQETLNKTIADQIALHQGVTGSLTQQADAAKAAYEAEEKSWEKMAETISAGEKVQYDEITKLHKEIAKDEEEQAKKVMENHKKIAESAKQEFDKVEGYFGSAVAKMLVEGESFTKAMQNAFKMMEEQIIEMIIKMITEWLLFEAITGMGGGGFAAQAFPKFAGGFAAGGTVVADRPTLAMFGEAGPETATFSPLGGAVNTGGGQGGATNINIQVTANGVSDPAELARMVGPELIREIRGMGQLNYVRA